MARFNRTRGAQEEDPDIDIIPIMNMFMVLIPFLLMSASFFQINAINTSVPVHADTPAKMEAPTEQRKITVVFEIKENQLRLSALADTPNDLSVSEKATVFARPTGTEIANAELGDYLKMLKDRYPDSDTMILIPDDGVSYREIIQAMDCARTHESESLFTNVVLSGSLG